MLAVVGPLQSQCDRFFHEMRNIFRLSAVARVWLTNAGSRDTHKSDCRRLKQLKLHDLETKSSTEAEFARASGSSLRSTSPRARPELFG